MELVGWLALASNGTGWMASTGSWWHWLNGYSTGSSRLLIVLTNLPALILPRNDFPPITNSWMMLLSIDTGWLLLTIISYKHWHWQENMVAKTMEDQTRKEKRNWAQMRMKKERGLKNHTVWFSIKLTQDRPTSIDQLFNRGIKSLHPPVAQVLRV